MAVPDARLRSVMAKKAVAAVLLVAMVAWAEMTLAPMLAMHAGHIRPRHEMAPDMPAERAAADHHAEHASMSGHPCCPGLHQPENAADLTLTTGAPPCEDPHSCCFRQGPQSVPAPASDIQRLAREMAPAVAVEINPERGTAKNALRDSVPALLPPPDLFGMTLRV